MLPRREEYDFLIIGGGLFGSYAALYLAQKGLRVALMEKEQVLFSKASVVNQARLHGGYHYPRSVATARMSDENKARFTREHRDFINFEFDKYYAIDRYSSLTDARQFERFCAFIDIPCTPIDHHPYISQDRLEALYLTKEYSFDPILIAHFYTQQLAEYKNIDIKLGSFPVAVEKLQTDWVIEYSEVSNERVQQIKVAKVLNATYASSNRINALFGMPSLDLMHEISEMAFVYSPQFQDIGLTVMDGPFGSLMPYGKSGLHSLSSVAYTHHKVSYDAQPSFVCQQENTECRPEHLSICNYCSAQPITNQHKMIQQIKAYLAEEVALHYYFSYYTVKSKLRANYIDYGRPTEVSLFHENPDFYCIFAGKINSIYEIEKVIAL